MGLPELAVVILIILLVFGAAKLPELARSMGKSVKEFKKGMNGGKGKEKPKGKRKKSRKNK